MRVYMDGRVIVSTRERKVQALGDVVSETEEGEGPTGRGGGRVEGWDECGDRAGAWVRESAGENIELAGVGEEP
ncbi:Zn(II) transporter [Escherichia coli]|nr:Zn(II) transporter [Escherichia coli]